MNAHLSFVLNPTTVADYSDRTVPWGFPIGSGNSLGEITFLRTYSRIKDDGTKETWVDTCARVISGMFSILKDHCLSHRTPWDEERAQRSAAEAFDRMFHMKWLPPGRGLWMLGSEFVSEEGSAALQNCAFLTTDGIAETGGKIFARLMEMSMLGVGVGFDTAGEGSVTVFRPEGKPRDYVVSDSREGWCDAVEALVNSYLRPGSRPLQFDVGQIRPAGTPIKRFGGTAAGPAPLLELLDAIASVLDPYAATGSTLDSRGITDVMNLIGRCVVAGNVRRSAEIALGRVDDKDFINLKRYDLPENSDRGAWGWLSNNSVVATIDDSLDHITEAIAHNGEPGVFFLDLAQQFGRLSDPADGRDYRVKGCNPCAEQSLEPHECCTLVETFISRHDGVDDYLRTLKFAYLYAKSITLLPTHWEETNEVMTRNRRIGTSMSGLAQFVEAHGWTALSNWMDAGYKTIGTWDHIYSEWLGVRESIKTTSIKPSGTVSLLAGVTPGVHWPVHTNYIRRIRFRYDDPMVQAFVAAGYRHEPDVHDAGTMVVEFPVLGPEVRAQDEVTVWEKAELAALAQAKWADNMVSATFTFVEGERDQIPALIQAFTGRLKTMSFLPPTGDGTVYAQMPYEAITEDEYRKRTLYTDRVDLSGVYAGGALDAEGEAGCTTDACEIRFAQT